MLEPGVVEGVQDVVSFVKVLVAVRGGLSPRRRGQGRVLVLCKAEGASGTAGKGKGSHRPRRRTGPQVACCNWQRPTGPMNGKRVPSHNKGNFVPLGPLPLQSCSLALARDELPSTLPGGLRECCPVWGSGHAEGVGSVCLAGFCPSRSGIRCPVSHHLSRSHLCHLCLFVFSSAVGAVGPVFPGRSLAAWALGRVHHSCTCSGRFPALFYRDPSHQRRRCTRQSSAASRTHVSTPYTCAVRRPRSPTGRSHYAKHGAIVSLVRRRTHVRAHARPEEPEGVACVEEVWRKAARHSEHS